jgi:hypothetical protein
MTLAYSTICTLARTGTGPCAQVVADAPPPPIEPDAADASAETDEFTDAGERARRPSRSAAANPRRRETVDGVGECPTRRASLHAALRRPGAGRSASVSSRALALVLSASSRDVAHGPSSGVSLSRPSMLRMLADLRSADVFAADRKVGARAR